MIIEFAGLPGSGKTTLVSYLLKHSRGKFLPMEALCRAHFVCEPQIPIYKRLVMKSRRADRYLRMSERLLLGHAHAYIASYLRDRPDLDSTIFEAIELAKGLGLHHALSVAAYCRAQLAMQNILLRQNPRHAHILVDEGFFVQLANLHPEAFSMEPFVVRYYSVIPMPDVLVFLRADPGLALERLTARDKDQSKKIRRFNAEFYGWLQRAYDQGLEIFKARGVKVLDIEKSHSVEVVRDRILDVVDKRSEL